MALETIALTLVALVAFASNSLLARLALDADRIDAATFTLLRLASGATVLSLVVRARRASPTSAGQSDVLGPLSLFAYAAPFSFAYLRIGAAVGALVLFGAVQLTMVGYGVVRGERPPKLAWLGLFIAVLGLAALTVPSASRPDPLGFVLMVIAGIAWGVYSLVGRTSPDALAANARSFALGCPLAALLVLAFRETFVATGTGVALALASGGLTSGLGYAVWYRALPRLSVTQAAAAQLCVPVIAAVGAVTLLDERWSARLGLAGAAVLGGVALVLVARSRAER